MKKKNYVIISVFLIFFILGVKFSQTINYTTDTIDILPSENFDYGYNPLTKTFINYDGLEFGLKKDGILWVKKEGKSLSYFGFVLSGEYDGKRYIYKSDDFNWTWEHKEVGEEHIFISYNNNIKFNWTAVLHFYPDKPVKISHILTNNFNKNITNVKMWYIHTVNEEDIVRWGGNYLGNNSTNNNLTGDLNNIRKILLLKKYVFDYGDLIDNGFEIKNIYFGNGSILNYSNKNIVGVGFSKGNGVLAAGKKVKIDPTITTFVIEGENPFNTGNSWTCVNINSSYSETGKIDAGVLAVDMNDNLHVIFMNMSGVAAQVMFITAIILEEAGLVVKFLDVKMTAMLILSW